MCSSNFDDAYVAQTEEEYHEHYVSRMDLLLTNWLDNDERRKLDPGFTGGLEFSPEEAAIAASLTQATEDEAALALSRWDVVERQGITIARMNDFIAATNRSFEDRAKTLEDEMEALAMGSFVLGSATRTRAVKFSLTDLPIVGSVVKAFSSLATWAFSRFFNQFVAPSLEAEILKAINTAGLDSPDFSEIRALLTKRFRSSPYWFTVANNIASRAYHYGYVKSAEALGFRTVTYRATIDEVTSEICQYLDGMVFQVATVIRIAERAANSSPEEIMEQAPFRPAEDIVGKTNAELERMGVVVPPQHFNCRSTLEVN
jgi:hypothetical protein